MGLFVVCWYGVYPLVLLCNSEIIQCFKEQVLLHFASSALGFVISWFTGLEIET